MRFPGRRTRKQIPAAVKKKRKGLALIAVVGEPEFVSQVEAMFEADFAGSRENPADECTGKSLWFRLGVRLARLAAPLQ